MATPSTLKAVESPPMPSEMETLEKKLAAVAKTLELAADRLSSRMDAFLQRAQGGCPEEVEPNPGPGTLGALHYWVGRIDKQTDRLQGSVEDVAAVL